MYHATQTGFINSYLLLYKGRRIGVVNCDYVLEMYYTQVPFLVQR